MPACRPLTNDEVRALRALVSTRPRDRALVELMLSSGARIQEALDLDIRDVKGIALGPGTPWLIPIRSTKGGASGHLILAHEAKTAVLAYVTTTREGAEDGDPLFLSRENGRLTQRQALRVIRGLANELHLSGQLSTHCIRKTFAQMLLDANVPTLRISHLLRHKKFSSTEKYVQTCPSKAGAVIEAILEGLK